MKVCVTGGAGYIGWHLVCRLIEQGHQVVVVDNLENGTRIHPKSRFFSHDIREIDQMEDALVGTEVFFHLAADKRATSKDYYDMVSVNTAGTTAVLEVAKKIGAKRFVFASSAAVYFPKDDGQYSESETVTRKNPANIYGLSKLQSEEICEFFSDSTFKTVCLRYFNVFGGEYTPNAMFHKSAVEHFIDAMRQNKPVGVYGKGDAVRDYIHVDDVVKANLLAMNYESSEKGKHSHIFNICTGKGTTTIDLARLVCGSNYPVNFMPERDNEQKYCVGSPDRAANELGFVPENALKDFKPTI